ncbi:MAG: ABC transporter permease subunit [Lachnospiraceae bacterium]|nr:ABC transporter permease subunit [Lachnospiraceae bacterium]
MAEQEVVEKAEEGVTTEEVKAELKAIKEAGKEAAKKERMYVKTLGAKREKEDAAPVFWVQRILCILGFFAMFFPEFSPSRISTELISENMSLFTSATSYGRLVEYCDRFFRKGYISKLTFILLFAGSLLLMLGVVAASVGTCASLGNRKLKKRAMRISLCGSIGVIAGLGGIILAYTQLLASSKADKIGVTFPMGIIIFGVFAVLNLLVTIIGMVKVPAPEAGDDCEMETPYKLFLMFLPFAILAFIFCYLPLYGWRYAFFNYKAGEALTADNFVGFQKFTYLFKNAATRNDLGRVIRNTLVMSGLGILTSWIPLAFAVFLTEIKNMKFRRFVQTFTTIPNFISWILVYAIAFALFSSEGLINNMALQADGTHKATMYLQNKTALTWLQMLGWGIWKGVGWSAIIYIAGISGIDRQLYEAATVDGAGRFQRIWHVTLPGLIPTYMVMLLMSVAGMLSNGLDQYLAFCNSANKSFIEVLDLYVYKLGIADGNISLSTVVGMAKSVISVALLFMANGISKAIRGENIV